MNFIEIDENIKVSVRSIESLTLKDNTVIVQFTDKSIRKREFYDIQEARYYFNSIQ
jgi:hypothetical protein